MSINYRTFKDLAYCIKKNMYKLPDFDMVVGIPRSGMIPAYMIGMFLNKKVCSIDELINGIDPSSGYSRAINDVDVQHVIIVDDSIHSGIALNKTKEKIKNANLEKKIRIEYLAIYAREQSKDLVDYYFEILPLPRLFQWNYLNVKMSNRFCYDFDGVLCVDPSEDDNDDGQKYREFLLNAKPLYLPKSKIYAIVTSRLEKYRPETEEWLKKNNVQYDNLFMLNLESKEERIKLGCHAKFKADIYSKIQADLFIESNDKQAREIAKISKLPVICAETDSYYDGSVEEEYVSVTSIREDPEIDYQSINMKKVLLFTQEFTYTGAPHSLLRIAKILIKNDYYVEVCGPSYGVFAKEFEKIGIRVRIVPYARINNTESIAYIKNFNLAIVNTAIPHQYYQTVVNYCPTIWYIREATNLMDICNGVPERRAALSSASKLYCVSEYAQEYIKQNFNRKTYVVHNCVEDETTNPGYFMRRPSGVINFIQMGSISKRKSFDVLVSAFQSLPPEYQSKAHLYLAGQLIVSQDDFWAPLLESIKESDNITYLGEIKSIEQKIHTLCDMDVIVVASRDESCSLVALEGLMLSKPVILSENVGAKYAVSEKNGWIVKTGSIEDLRAKMQLAIDCKDKLYDMGQFSRVSYEIIANMDIYEKNIMGMIKENEIDVLSYRMSRKSNVQISTIRKAYDIWKYEGLKKLIAAIKMHNKNKGQNKMNNISIIGTSASKIPIDMVDGLKLRHNIGKCSILSSEYPTHNEKISYSDIHDREVASLSLDLSKKILETFKNAPTEYLLIDLLDERFNLCRIKYAYGCEIVATKSNVLMNNIGKISINGVTLMDEYLSIIDFSKVDYERKIAAFTKKLKGIFKQNKIIINEVYLATRYVDNKRDIVNFEMDKLSHIEDINSKLNKLYSALKNNIPNAHVIKMPEFAVADVHHKQGLNPMQFEEEYYEYVAESIKKIVG